MTLILWLLVLSGLFMAFTHLLRVLPPKTGLLLFVIIVVVAHIYQYNYPPGHELSLFVILKLYSVCLAVIYIYWMKFTSSKWYSLGQKIGYLILFVNILEATFFDFIDQDYFNGLLGIGLLITLKSPKAISLNQDSKYKDLEYDLSLAWVLAYCFWNFVFNFNFEEGANIPLTFLHLILPLLLSLSNPKIFIQHRTYFLAYSVLWLTTFPIEPPFLFKTPGIFIPWLAHILTTIGFVCIGVDLLKRRKMNTLNS